MRAKGRKQGRFIALSGLKKITSPPGSRFPVMVIDATGLPVFPLCEWYRRKKEHDDGRTPDTYLAMLQPYFGFLLSRGYAWNAPPDRVRAYLVEFLRPILAAMLTLHHKMAIWLKRPVLLHSQKVLLGYCLQRWPVSTTSLPMRVTTVMLIPCVPDSSLRSSVSICAK